MLNARRVGIAYGWMWIKQGFWLFKQNPFLWMFLASIIVVGMFALALFPLLGAVLPALLYPAAFAGLMLGCHALAQHQPLEPQHVLAGFRAHGRSLLLLGVLNTVVNQLVGVLMIQAAGGEKFVNDLRNVMQQPDPQAMMAAIDKTGIMLTMDLFGLVSFMLLFVVQIAAMLIVFRGVTPVAALLAALRATLRNVLPVIVFGLMLVPLFVLAMLPAMLGLIVLAPIVLASQYAVYRDMFPMPGDAGAVPGPDAPGPDSQAPGAPPAA